MDHRTIRETTKRRYAAVAFQPQGQFGYPVGRGSIERLGYDLDWVESIPAEVVDRYVGVGNPFSPGMPRAGANVLDIGCGAGFDTLFAARCIGPTGTAIGIDISAEMIAFAAQGAREARIDHACFVLACAERLPIPDGWADLVISDGALNLSVCKPAAFAEIFRVLRPGGRFQAADLLLTGALPEDLRKDEFAWSA